MKTTGESQEETAVLEQYNRMVVGAEEEENLFNKLRDVLTTLQVRNTIVINGWKDNGSQVRTTKEFDFLIISEPLKTIVHIEVKRHLNAETRDKAAKQLENGRKLFQDTIPFPKDENWKYIRVMYGSSICLADDACTNQEDCICQRFVISPKTDLLTWWQMITKLIDTKTTTQGQKEAKTYTEISKFLVHQLFQQEQNITQDDITEDSEKNIDAINTIKPRRVPGKEICFLTEIQFAMFHDDSNTRVAFSSAYGTGKTTLLKAKARYLLDKGSHVTIILFDDQKATNDFLLKKSYDQEFSSFDKVNIVLMKETGKNYLK